MRRRELKTVPVDRPLSLISQVLLARSREVSCLYLRVQVLS